MDDSIDEAIQAKQNHQNLTKLLLECGEFGTHDNLVDFFARPTLRPFLSGLPEKNSRNSRVESIYSYLIEKYTKRGESALNVMLGELSEIYSHMMLGDQLAQLADKFPNQELQQVEISASAHTHGARWGPLKSSTQKTQPLSDEEEVIVKAETYGNILNRTHRNVSLSYDLPVLFEEGSCHIEFSHPAHKNLSVSLSHAEILKRLMLGLETTPSGLARPFLQPVGGGEFEARFGQTRLALSYREARDLCKYVDIACRVYQNRLSETEDVFETWNYQRGLIGQMRGFLLCNIKPELWILAKKFADEFDYGSGKTAWHIFWLNNHAIRVAPGFVDSVLIEPSPHVMNGRLAWMNMFYVVDRAHHFPTSSNSWRDAVREHRVWTATYTRAWLIQEFLPKVCAYYDAPTQWLPKLEPEEVGLDQVSEPRQLTPFIEAIQMWLYRYPTDLKMDACLLRPYYKIISTVVHALEPQSIQRMKYVVGKAATISKREHGELNTWEDVVAAIDEHVVRVGRIRFEWPRIAEMLSRLLVIFLEDGTMQLSQVQLDAFKQTLLPLWKQSRFEMRYCLQDPYSD